MPVKVFGVSGLGLVDVELSDLKSGWSKVSGWGTSAIVDDTAVAPLRFCSRDGICYGLLTVMHARQGPRGRVIHLRGKLSHESLEKLPHE